MMFLGNLSSFTGTAETILLEFYFGKANDMLFPSLVLEDFAFLHDQVFDAITNQMKLLPLSRWRQQVPKRNQQCRDLPFENPRRQTYSHPMKTQHNVKQKKEQAYPYHIALK